jgi:hypothetical protein
MLSSCFEFQVMRAIMVGIGLAMIDITLATFWYLSCIKTDYLFNFATGPQVGKLPYH